jgi:hypothetical protein
MNRQYREATTVYARILEIDETDPVARVMLRKCGEQLDAVEVSSA